MSWERVAAALEGLQKEFGRHQETFIKETRDLRQEVAALNKNIIQVRENSHLELTFDTATTNKEGIFKLTTLFGGVAASSLEVVSVGGGTLQIMLPGEDWRSVVQGDLWEDEVIREFRCRATTGAAGTARFRVGAYVG